jgi:hypothetical protein
MSASWTGGGSGAEALTGTSRTTRFSDDGPYAPLGSLRGGAGQDLGPSVSAGRPRLASPTGGGLATPVGVNIIGSGLATPVGALIGAGGPATPARGGVGLLDRTRITSLWGSAPGLADAALDDAGLPAAWPAVATSSWNICPDSRIL